MGKSPRKYSALAKLLSMAVVGGFIVSFCTLNTYVSIFTFQNIFYLRYANPPSVVKDRLDIALENTSMANKTVIIAMVNKAYVEGGEMNMFDLFLESFWVGEETRWLINHLLVVAVDEVAYQRCMFRGLHCYNLQTYNMDFREEGVYMSKNFIKMMWLRTFFLGQVLKKGYNFIFSDVDVMWLRNPLKLLKTELIGSDQDDIQFSVDYYNGNPKSTSNPINTGFYFIRSNNKTISLFQIWYAKKDHPNLVDLKEQDILQTLIRRGKILRYLNLTVAFLDTRHFSGFCQVSDDPREVITLHANCCRYIKAKVTDLTHVLRDWQRFRTTLIGKTTVFKWSGHVECLRSWEDEEESRVSLEPALAPTVARGSPPQGGVISNHRYIRINRHHLSWSNTIVS